MNYDLELRYCTLDKEQIKEFAYNITDEIISKYIEEHQKEYAVWQDEEYLKEIIRVAVNPPAKSKTKDFGIKERIQLLEKLKKQTEMEVI